MKALVVGILAIEIMCDTCEELCENMQGSTMIDLNNSIVICTKCNTHYRVTNNAFKATKVALKEYVND